MKKLKNIKVYTKSYCPFCTFIKNYLTKNNYEFENIELEGNDDLYNDLKKKTNHLTVPQIFVGDEFIGGSEDFLSYLKG